MPIFQHWSSLNSTLWYCLLFSRYQEECLLASIRELESVKFYECRHFTNVWCLGVWGSVAVWLHWWIIPRLYYMFYKLFFIGVQSWNNLSSKIFLIRLPLNELHFGSSPFSQKLNNLILIIEPQLTQFPPQQSLHNSQHFLIAKFHPNFHFLISQIMYLNNPFTFFNIEYQIRIIKVYNFLIILFTCFLLYVCLVYCTWCCHVLA